jgi:hypothetical protein
MKLTKLIFLSLAVAACVGCSYEPVDTFVESQDPNPLTQEQVDAWAKVGEGLNASWADPDVRHSRSTVPANLVDGGYKLTLWKGEKGGAMVMLWAAEAVDGVECKVGEFKSTDAVLPASVAQARFVRYTLSDEVLQSGRPKCLVPDMLDDLDRFDMAEQTARPVWITVSVPQDAASGVYKTSVTLTHNGRGKVILPLEVEVVDHVLPEPAKWNYHLDLWQHPTAVARINGLQCWSDAHFEALRPQMELLAAAGQKVITANLNKDPWNHQCYDAYDNMIKWIKMADGNWVYDYTVFDRWVEFMLGLGINKMINCYSMLPWNCELEYLDEIKAEKVTVVAEPGTPIFTEMWTPFLKDFKKHLEQKGWLNITNIAMDERSPETMQIAADLLEKIAPEMGFALADNHESYKKFTMMRDVCLFQRQELDPKDLELRRSRGQNTTFYICCAPPYPNTFTSSDPYEAELLGWYGVAKDFDGMLRWAYNSWPENPMMDSSFGNWPAGDTYFTYPGARSSIRFERLIEGIQAAEKVRILRKKGVDVSELDKAFEKLLSLDINDPKQPWHEITNELEAIMAKVSR